MTESETTLSHAWDAYPPTPHPAALLSACGDEEQPAATATSTPAATPEATLAPASLTFMAGFKPQANLPFVGAYVAQEKGFFQEQGLDVKIEHSAHLRRGVPLPRRRRGADHHRRRRRRAGATLRRPARAAGGRRPHRPDGPAGLRRPRRFGHRDPQGLGGQDLRLQGQPAHARLPGHRRRGGRRPQQDPGGAGRLRAADAHREEGRHPGRLPVQRARHLGPAWATRCAPSTPPTTACPPWA